MNTIPSWVSVAIATLILIIIAVVLQLVLSLRPRPSPFTFDLERTRTDKPTYCPGEAIKIKLHGTASTDDAVIVEVVHAIEQNMVTVFRPRVANSLRYPAKLFDEGDGTLFDTAEFYRDVGAFPTLPPGDYNYRHGIAIPGFDDISFTVPFTVVPC